MKKLSFAMFVIVGLFMLFSGIHSVYGGGKQQAKEAVIVKQVKVGGGPVCLSENTPLVFYDRSMDIIEVIFTSGTESKTGLLVISGNYGQVTEQFDPFNGKSIIPIPELVRYCQMIQLFRQLWSGYRTVRPFQREKHHSDPRTGTGILHDRTVDRQKYFCR